ncbi:MAG: 3-oxoacyl-ACP reductase FabG [Candidatus Krumholzibacteriota bacterium]|nr:3-oxoacyl-ACP reductase FabG [Candidatus Krumholzibacteriota bacterium]
MSDLAGKLALVTGGTRGIGRGIVAALLAADCRVALVGSDPGRSAAAAGELGPPDRVRGFGGDIGDPGAVAGLVAAATADLGEVDFLVNNAGITRDNLFVRLKTEEWDRVLAVNLSGAYHFCRALARPMMKRRAGRIVNISSVVGQIGNAGQVNYAASKAGLIGLTKSLARELAPRGVTVNAVAPGFIRTDMTDSLPPEAKDALLAGIPMGCLGEPADVAAAVLFLLGPGARYITGQVLGVNGGMVMQG